ncbi:hypothetical protein HPB48_006152 [Haemaphysalis longicornis]|uniref:Carboxylesterase type B domain-containing protein n=1 Tax=Haemaphysalis longicornis TaxID=44386 RepID=A0A9J6GNK2_HAELO|nr:hypothetical protein HPB48_006152 [Haemaphysalis longicornis]
MAVNRPVLFVMNCADHSAQREHERRLPALECVDAVHGGEESGVQEDGASVLPRTGLPMGRQQLLRRAVAGRTRTSRRGDAQLPPRCFRIPPYRFGGNSTDIVLLGSGSGAWSVGAHMLGATARGASDQFWKHERFRKVILMSESPLRRRFPARSQALSLRLGCPPEDIAAQLMCLRNKSARAILDQTNKAKDFLFPSLVPTSAEVDNVPGRRFFIGTVSNEGSHMAQRVKSVRCSCGYK